MSVPRLSVPRPALPLALAGLLLLTSCGGLKQPATPANDPLDPAVLEFVKDIRVIDPGDHVVVLTTSKGMIAIEMRNQKAPLTTTAIERLITSKFYNGLQFYRVERRFKIQIGDPTNGAATSTGTPKIKLEITPDLTNDLRGAVGMARPEDEPDGADSQFYILLAPKKSLDGQYAVFGQVVKGMSEVVDRIEKADVVTSAVVGAGLEAKPQTASSMTQTPTAPAVPAVPAR